MAKKLKSSSWKEFRTHWKETISISSRLLVLLAAVSGLTCSLDPSESTSQRSRLGEVKIAVVASYRNTEGVLEMEFRGHVSTPLEPRDSSYTIANVGTFKRRIVLRDTLSTRRDSVTLFYSFPLGLAPRIDPTMTLVFLFKRTATGLGFILKTKSDTLVCMAGTFAGADLETFEAQGGVQNFRVISGNNAHVTRTTDCGREADYNIIFSTNDGSVDVPPTQGASFQSGRYVYTVYNVINTQVVKNVKDCENYSGESAYVILRQ
jgi:hypothetical protein